MEYHQNILGTIGNTPLVKLNKITNEVPGLILAKIESFNPGNSIKDRMALKMVEDAESNGNLKKGGVIIEGTSGNTGMGLALASRVKGYKLICVTTDKQSKEKVDILKALGAEVKICPTDVDPEDPKSYYSTAKRISKEIPNAWYADQYNNLSNTMLIMKTGPEIWKQTGKSNSLCSWGWNRRNYFRRCKIFKGENKNIKIWVLTLMVLSSKIS